MGDAVVSKLIIDGQTYYRRYEKSDDPNKADKMMRYDEDGNLLQTYYYMDDDINHTRKTMVDYDNDGRIDSYTFFQDDEFGNCLYSMTDFDNNGKFDHKSTFEHNELGQLITRYDDSNYDGLNDEKTVFTYDEYGNCSQTTTQLGIEDYMTKASDANQSEEKKGFFTKVWETIKGIFT